MNIPNASNHWKSNTNATMGLCSDMGCAKLINPKYAIKRSARFRFRMLSRFRRAWSLWSYLLLGYHVGTFLMISSAEFDDLMSVPKGDIFCVEVESMNDMYTFQRIDF